MANNVDPAQKILDLVVNNDILEKSKSLVHESYETFINSPVLDVLPVVRSVVGVVKGSIAVDQYIYARKVLIFLSEIEGISAEKRNDFINQLTKGVKLNRVGVTILELLDKSSTDLKSKLIGELFVLHLEEIIPYDDFVRMAEMVNGAYISDLEYFFKMRQRVIGETGDEVEHLLILGFYERPKVRFGDRVMDGVQPQLTKYGALIHKAHKKQTKN